MQILTDAQIAVRDAVRSYAQDAIRPNAFAFERAGHYPQELFVDMAAIGLMGMTAPEEGGA